MNDNENRKIVSNPVLKATAPWRSRPRENNENPVEYLKKCKGGPPKRQMTQAEMAREENIRLLQLRFPDLKKYQARAALTMASQKLEKAIVLLEVSQSYHRESIVNRPQTAYLSKIFVNLKYDFEMKDPTIRNITVLNTFNKKSSKISGNSSSDSKNEKLGVKISKVGSGYKVGPLF